MALEEAIQQLEADINSELDHTQVLEWLKQLRSFRAYAKDELERKKQELKAAQKALRLELAVSQIQFNTRVP